MLILIHSGIVTVLIALSLLIFGLLVGAIMMLLSVLGGAQLVTTSKAAWPLIIDLAGLKPAEVFVELGSGFGYVSGYVARSTPARVIGIDLAPLWVWLARLIQGGSGANFRIGNVFATDLKMTDVVYCYLLPPMLTKLENKFEVELQPGSRVITYGFPLTTRRPHRVIERTATHGPLYCYHY
mgnify:CR=1 FL=1